VVEVGGGSMQVSRKFVSRVVVSIVGVMAFISITSLHTTLKDAKVKDSKLAELQEVVAEKDSELEIKSEEITFLESRVSLLQAQMAELEEELSVVWNASSEEIPEWEIDIFELTGYAPFDDPVGLCSDGNPESTELVLGQQRVGQLQLTQKSFHWAHVYGLKAWVGGLQRTLEGQFVVTKLM